MGCRGGCWAPKRERSNDATRFELLVVADVELPDTHSERGTSRTVMLCLGVEMNVNAIYQADQLVRYSGWLHANPSTTLLREVYLAHGSRFSASGNASLTIIDGPGAGKTLSDLYNMLLAARRSRVMQRHQRSDPGGHGIGYDRPMAGRASPRALAFPSGDGALSTSLRSARHGLRRSGTPAAAIAPYRALVCAGDLSGAHELTKSPDLSARSTWAIQSTSGAGAHRHPGTMLERAHAL